MILWPRRPAPEWQMLPMAPDTMLRMRYRCSQCQRVSETPDKTCPAGCRHERPTFVCAAIEWGTFHIWKRGSWALQFYFPCVWLDRARQHVRLDLDTAFRFCWGEPALGVRLFGWGVGWTRRTETQGRLYRNDGACWHGVDLNRTCAECRREHPKVA